MLKLVAHIVVALSFWYGSGSLELSVGLRIAAVVLGAVAVHTLWEKFVFDPYLYLGALPVATDDPVMAKALDEARRTFPMFLKIYPEHVEHSMVRFAFETDGGETENLWGDLLEYTDTEAKVFVRTPQISHSGEFERTRTVPADKINDWQVEFSDGTLHGGYTNRALFTVYERERGPLPKQLREQLDRLMELDA
jgi:uncharacterized protein YegJ (DUF2314 family)